MLFTNRIEVNCCVNVWSFRMQQKLRNAKMVQTALFVRVKFKEAAFYSR